MSKYSITVEQDVDLDEFDDDDIIDYMEEQGYTVIKSAANSSESAGSLDTDDDRNYFHNSLMAIGNITRVCRKYEDLCPTFYNELLAAILFLPATTDKDTLLQQLKTKMQ